MIDLDLSNLEYAYPEDAKMQISKSIEYLSNFFPKKITGIWSSEGSLSNDVLDIMLDLGFTWTASDEKILYNSLDNVEPTAKYFPYRYTKNGNGINLFFRDNKLSDKIGFEYSNWNEYDAANDFINELHHIRRQIESQHGVDSLNDAVVTIILDGENCWEYYKNNGIDFLNILYEKLSTPEFETVLFSDDHTTGNIISIESIKAGSWINGDFAIWISSEQTQIAWRLLADARKEFEIIKNSLNKKTYDEVYENLLIAEGSDWFWWYHTTHHSELEPEFDLLFRNRLQTVYKFLNIEIPMMLLQPIGDFAHNFWANENSSMHKTGNY